MITSAKDTPLTLRTRLKALRREIPAAERERGSLLIRGRLYTWLATNRSRLHEAGRPDVRRIAAFWSLPDEPELQPLLAQWAADETLEVLLPAVTGPDRPLEFRRWNPGAAMHAGPYGILEPEGPVAAAPDVVLVPTLGYTRQGDRVGYGGGYYDRTLTALRVTHHPVVTLGIAWACGDLSGETYAPAAHDVRLDSILTDKGWAVAARQL